MELSYKEFADKYTKVVARGAEAWGESDPQLQLIGITNALNALTQADTYYSAYVDRLALLGPELGGTVLGQSAEN